MSDPCDALADLGNCEARGHNLFASSVSPLEQAGYIADARHVGMGFYSYIITEAGKNALKERRAHNQSNVQPMRFGAN